MKLLYRRLIYLSFIAVFFLLTPILIFYTSGYKLNFKKLKIEKTGILVVETKPKEANVYIDNKIIAEKTPVQLSKILPSSYDIKVEAQGYHSWQKNLEIKSNLTTFAKGIILFKESLPILKIPQEITQSYVLPKKEMIIYLVEDQDKQEIKIRDLKKEEEISLLKLTANQFVNLEEILPTASQNKILITLRDSGVNKFFIYDLEKKNLTDLLSLANINFSLLRWDSLNENFIYGYKSGILYQIDLINSTINRLLAAQITDFKISDFQIYYISTDNLLNRESILDKDSKTSIKLPTNSNFGFDQSSTDYLTIIDNKNQELIVLDSQVFQNSNELINHIILQAKANDVVWTGESKNLLYYNDFELWVYNFDTRETQLLTRLSKEIIKSYWYTDNKYVIYQTKDKINVIELDQRDRRNDITLTQIEEISNSLLDDKGDKIYFIGKIGNQAGIFELQIR